MTSKYLQTKDEALLHPFRARFYFSYNVFFYFLIEEKGFTQCAVQSLSSRGIFSKMHNFQDYHK